MAHYLVCYDIANPRRLGRVHRCTVKYAAFVQYSVYYLEGSQATLDELMEKLAAIINHKEDDVRAYAVEPLSSALQLGRPWLPEGIILG